MRTGCGAPSAERWHACSHIRAAKGQRLEGPRQQRVVGTPACRAPDALHNVHAPRPPCVCSLCLPAQAKEAAGAKGPAPPRAPGAPYEIRSAFPQRAYTDMEETLRAAGLTPNATLFMRAL